MQRLNELTATEALRRLAAREISAEQMARACLDLAQRRHLPLATLDKKLRAACRAAKVEVL